MRHRLLLLTALLILAPVAAVGCDGGGEEESAPSSPPAEPTPPAEPSAAQPPPAELDDPAAGGAVFANAGCGGCHTLEAAGSSGSLGPNLDDLKPSFDRVVSQVTSGGGGMPAFGDQLSEQEILDVAAFVVRSTGG